jgi:DNA primase
MRIPDSVIDEISRRVDIVELVGSYVTLKQRGSRYLGLCPFHQEKTPSFSVDPSVGAYYCFGCHQGGGAFKFLMEIEGLTFPEAVRQLGEQVGVSVEAGEESPADRSARALEELYERVSTSLVHFIRQPEGARARETLERRAISNEMIERFGLGFSPRDPYWLHGFLRSKGYSAEFLEQSGLFTKANPRRALFSGRLMFPIRSRRGRVLAFGGRLLEGEGPKYINSPDTAIYRKRENLFGVDLALQKIRAEKTAVLAEGYMDVIALHQSGVDYAVAPLGTAFTPEQASFLARYIDRAILLFDSDSAGAAATRKTAELLEPHGIAVDVVLLDAGSDPADLLVSGGSRQVLNALSSPLTILEFLVRRNLQERSAAGHEHLSSPRTKEAVLRDIYPYVRLMTSEVKRDESLRLLSDLLSVDVSAVQRDFRTGARGTVAKTKGSNQSSQLPRAALSHDLYLMLATVQHRDEFAYVRRYVLPEDLEDRAAREIYLALEECFRRDEDSLEDLLERVLDPDVVTLVRERIASGEFERESRRGIEDAVRAIRVRGILGKRRAIESELRRLSSLSDAGDSDYAELLGEKMVLDRELQKLKGEGE